MRLPFTYPPFALIALSPLAWLNFIWTQSALWALSVSLTAGALLLALRTAGVRLTTRTCYAALGSVCASVLVLEPVRSDMDYGQIELILMALTVIDFLAAPRKVRGALIGIVASVKLTPLIFILAFIAVRDFKSGARSLATFAACTALSWGFFPSASRKFWLSDVRQPGRTGNPIYAGNQCWYAVITRLTFLGGARELAWIVVSLGTLGIGIFVAWRCGRDNRPVPALVATALTGLLISPISWSHHWVWVIFIPLAAWGQEGTRGKGLLEACLAGIIALTILSPYWLLQGSGAGEILQALLPLWTGGVLVVWAAVEWRGMRAGAAVAQGDALAEFAT